MKADQPHQSFAGASLSGHLSAPFSVLGSHHNPGPQAFWLTPTPLLKFSRQQRFGNYCQRPLPRAQGMARFPDVVQQAARQQVGVIMAESD